jgi:hypothetical protein
VATDSLLILALAGIVLGTALAAAMVARLVRIARRPELARAPIAPSSTVTFAEPGAAELAVEGPRFTTKLGPLSFEIVDSAGGPIPLRRLWMRTSRSGVRLVRLSLYGLEIPRAGAYTLNVTGMDPADDYDGCAVVFVRPQGPGLVATIVALLGSVGLAAGGAAAVGALFFGTTDAPEAPSPTGHAPPAAPARRLNTPTPDVPLDDMEGGRRLASDPARLRDGKDVMWPVLQMRVRVPAAWIIRRLSDTEIDLRDPTMPSTFLVGRASPMPAGPSIHEYLQADLVRAQENLAAKRIEGYAARRIGHVGGVLTLERRGGDDWMVNWTGLQPAELGSLSVTLLVGTSAADFAREEPLLGAVVDSIRFE